jgi:hypothetical protein
MGQYAFPSSGVLFIIAHIEKVKIWRNFRMYDATGLVDFALGGSDVGKCWFAKVFVYNLGILIASCSAMTCNFICRLRRIICIGQPALGAGFDD